MVRELDFVLLTEHYEDEPPNVVYIDMRTLKAATGESDKNFLKNVEDSLASLDGEIEIDLYCNGIQSLEDNPPYLLWNAPTEVGKLAKIEFWDED